MPEEKPLHRRVASHIIRSAAVCDEWCQTWRFYDRLLPTMFLLGILCFLLYYITIAPPVNFPGASLVKIEQNESLEAVAETLKAKHLINSTRAFVYMAHAYGAKDSVLPGEYFFPTAQSVITIARRLVRGDYELIAVKVTLPEGLSSYQMATILAKKIPDFDTQTFVTAAQAKEGYLFPDTYFFLPGEDPLEVISTMESNFKLKMSDPAVAAALASSSNSLSDIVTMASLIEKEANDTKNRRIIAGILWHRIAIHMPLQVDAVFPYIIGKNSLQLTRTDLKVESPYNTYTNQGLPPGPIANPGLDSILAAMTPIQTNYIFYLSDLNSAFHYSVTYKEQLANQNKYLR